MPISKECENIIIKTYGKIPLSFNYNKEMYCVLIDEVQYAIAKKIADTLGTVKNIKVSTSTIAKYLEYLIESFMFSEAKRYDVKGKK